MGQSTILRYFQTQDHMETVIKPTAHTSSKQQTKNVTQDGVKYIQLENEYVSTTGRLHTRKVSSNDA
jgi:hypothetical protein